jgi:hypothetical protein
MVTIIIHHPSSSHYTSGLIAQDWSMMSVLLFFSKFVDVLKNIYLVAYEGIKR